MGEKQKTIEERIKDAGDINEIENFIKNNEIVFDYKEKEYKVVKLNYKQKVKLNDFKIKQFSSLIQEKDENGNFVYKKEEELIKIYKERGIDIEKIGLDLKNLVQKKNEVNLKLGKAIVDKESDKELKNYKSKIESLNSHIIKLTLEKQALLDASLESKILFLTYSYVTHLATYIKNGDSWEVVWKTFDDYMNEEEDLINLATLRASLLFNQLT